MFSTRMTSFNLTGASDRVRYPWAMATPKGPFLARSGSTWIHWWSSVASAKRLTLSCVMVCHSEWPSSLPTRSWKASTPSTMVVMVRSSLVRIWFREGTLPAPGDLTTLTPVSSPHEHEGVPPHEHRDLRGGGARAAVFGISAGLVTNVSLFLGVAGATLVPSFVRL